MMKTRDVVSGQLGFDPDQNDRHAMKLYGLSLTLREEQEVLCRDLSFDS
jgi:hypothetical protein